MKANDRAVSADLYRTLTSEYPTIKTQPQFARLFGYLCWGTWTDELSGRLVLDSEILAQMLDKWKPWKQRNFRAHTFLKAFASATGLAIRYSNWDSTSGLSRVLTSLPLPPHIRAAVGAEEQNVSKALNLVSIVDGSKYNTAKQRAWREADRSVALERLADSACPDAMALGSYLNGVCPHRYTALLTNLEAAAQVARTLPKPDAARQQIRVLRAIRDQPVPFYVPSSRGRTVRLFGLNESLLSLKKEVRQTLAPHWRTADLRSAQLAIVATQWDIPLVQEFLRDYPGSIWDYLFAELEVERTDERKRAVKDALYAALYGRTPGFAAYMLSRTLGMPGIGGRFLRIPLVEELFLARERMFDKVQKARGARDVYGHWIHLVDGPDVLKGKKVDAASVLSQLAQAMEMKLLSPVIHSAIRERACAHGWAITLWKHDGFNFVSHKAEDERGWCQALRDAVKIQADSFGILTQLETE